MTKTATRIVDLLLEMDVEQTLARMDADERAARRATAGNDARVLAAKSKNEQERLACERQEAEAAKRLERIRKAWEMSATGTFADPSPQAAGIRAATAHQHPEYPRPVDYVVGKVTASPASPSKPSTPSMQIKGASGYQPR